MHTNNRLQFLLVVMFATLFSFCKSKNDVTGEQPKSTATPAEQSAKYNLDKIVLPPGFAISVFAEVPNARSMCWGMKGTLFIGNRDGHNVYAAVDSDNNGKADKVTPLLPG